MLLEKNIKKSLITILCLFPFFSYSESRASGFQLVEQNGSGVGDYHAGGAAEANDASTEYYNPAGLVRLDKKQIVGGLVQIVTSVQFAGTVTGVAVRSGMAQGGVFRTIPFFHYAQPINDRWGFGFGVAVPFGLATEYHNNSIASDASTLTSMQTVNIGPTVGYRWDDHWSLGGGVSLQYLRGSFNNFVSDIPGITVEDHNEGSDLGHAWNMGVLYQWSPSTRAGLSYRSRIVYDMAGTGTVYANSITYTDHIHARVDLPSTTQLSAYHQYNDRYTFLGTLMYTGWSVFRDLTIEGMPTAGGGLPARVDVPQHFRNTWNLVAGMHYRYSDPVTLKLGVGFDETPTNSRDRNLRLPDANRTVMAIGAHVQSTPAWGFDLGWTHLFIHKTSINNTIDIGIPVTTQGSISSSANVFGFQATWNL